MASLEARATGDLGMFFRAAGDGEAAAYWSRQCTRADYALPEPGVDCSWNYGPCLRAARGDWPGLREALDHYSAHGAGNEFNSPLYTGRVYLAAVLGALLGGGQEAWAFLHRWTGLLALQATVVGPPRKQETFRWAGEVTPLRDQPFNAFCAKVVRGDMEAWRTLANAVEGAGVPLPRGLVRFVIERRPGAVVTFWEGRSPTRQKPSVPAAAIVDDRRLVLAPAKWQIPSTQTRSRISETEVQAEADVAGVLPRLADAAGVLELD